MLSENLNRLKDETMFDLHTATKFHHITTVKMKENNDNYYVTE